MSDDIQSWLDYKDQFSVTTFTNPHERIEQLMMTVERQEEVLRLTEKNLTCLVAAKHSDEVLMRPWLDEVRKVLTPPAKAGGE